MDGVAGAWARWKAASARPLMAVAMAMSCCSRSAKSASIAYGGGRGREGEHRAGGMRLGMFSAHVSTCFESTASPTEKGGRREQGLCLPPLEGMRWTDSILNLGEVEPSPQIGNKFTDAQMKERGFAGRAVWI